MLRPGWDGDGNLLFEKRNILTSSFLSSLAHLSASSTALAHSATAVEHKRCLRAACARASFKATAAWKTKRRTACGFTGSSFMAWSSPAGMTPREDEARAPAFARDITQSCFCLCTGVCVQRSAAREVSESVLVRKVDLLHTFICPLSSVLLGKGRARPKKASHINSSHMSHHSRVQYHGILNFKRVWPP